MSIKQTYEILDVLNRALSLSLKQENEKVGKDNCFNLIKCMCMPCGHGSFWREYCGGKKIQLGPTMNKLVLLVKEVQ